MPHATKQSDTSEATIPVRRDPGPVFRPMTTFERDRAHTMDVRAVIDEYERQSTVIEAQKAKTVYAMQQIADLHRCGLFTKNDTLRYLDLLDDTVEFSSETQRLYHASNREQMMTFIDQTHKIIELGAKNVALEVNRDFNVKPQMMIDCTPVEPKRRGVVGRFLFGDP